MKTREFLGLFLAMSLLNVLVQAGLYLIFESVFLSVVLFLAGEVFCAIAVLFIISCPVSHNEIPQKVNRYIYKDKDYDVLDNIFTKNSNTREWELHVLYTDGFSLYGRLESEFYSKFKKK